METFHANYEVVYDVEASRQMSKACMRHFGWSWLKAGLMHGLYYIVPAFFAWAIVSFYANSYSYQGLLAVSLFSLSVGLFMPIHTYIQVADKRERDPNSGEVWQCELTEEGWSFCDKLGVRRFIPWTIMKLLFEHSDGWLVQSGSEQIWVFRGPLREAGLEEEFRTRIGTGSPGTGSKVD